MPFKPMFVGFPDVPGTYAAVIDLPEVDETGILRLPYIYDPSGNGSYSVSVGSPVLAEISS